MFPHGCLCGLTRPQTPRDLCCKVPATTEDISPQPGGKRRSGKSGKHRYCFRCGCRSANCKRDGCLPYEFNLSKRALESCEHNLKQLELAKPSTFGPWQSMAVRWLDAGDPGVAAILGSKLASNRCRAPVFWPCFSQCKAAMPQAYRVLQRCEVRMTLFVLLFV